MIFEAEQVFALPYPGPHEAALAFLRDPGRSLQAVPFLRHLTFDGLVVRADMVVHGPMIGELVLPFESEVVVREGGAQLLPRPLTGEAWAEVAGHGVVEGSTIQYVLNFRVHLSLPRAEKWGGAAFEKMFQAAARRTLERVSHEFPAGVRAAMP